MKVSQWKNRELKTGPRIFIYLCAIIGLVYAINSQTVILQSEIIIKEIISEEINYDAFREFMLKEKDIKKADNMIKQVEKRYPKLTDYQYVDSIGYFTFFMMANGFEPGKNAYYPDAKMMFRAIGQLSVNPNFQELYQYYRVMFEGEVQIFPVPYLKDDRKDISYTNSWFGERNYGGTRKHEGTDIMDLNNVSGYFPVLSMTDGVVEKIGWLEMGGKRIGIRSKEGAYYYYAHLHSYEDSIKVGDEVIRGQLIGFMGDTGYGEEGTTGQFDVHLHLGIYLPSKMGDLSINPYWLLKIIEVNRES